MHFVRIFRAQNLFGSKWVCLPGVCHLGKCRFGSENAHEGFESRGKSRGKALEKRRGRPAEKKGSPDDASSVSHAEVVHQPESRRQKKGEKIIFRN